MADCEVSGWVANAVSQVSLIVRPVRLAEVDDERLTAMTPAPSPSLVVEVVVWILAAIVCVFAVPLTPFVLMYLANQRLLHTRLTDFELRVPERYRALGEWTPVTLRFQLKRPIDVAKLSITIDGTKRWKSGDNNRSHCFHTQTITLLEESCR